MAEQLSLFVEENTLFNSGTEQLLDMDFTGCKKTFQSYARLFSWGRDVSQEMGMAEFWIERLGEKNWDHVEETEALRIYEIWLEFEERFGHPWPEYGIEHLFQERFFSQLVDGLDKSGHSETPKLSGRVPRGFFYLLAGRLDAAVTSLQTLIAVDPEDAKAHGYLGDAFLLGGDIPTARECYRRAFALAPSGVDIKHLCDSELKIRMEDLEADERFDGDSLGWFPTVAKLEGLFEPLIIIDMEHLRYWLQRYQCLLDIYNKDREPAHIPRLFYHAMVLSDNASALEFLRDVDLIEIRQNMREWQSDLFAWHMENLGERESRSKARFPQASK